MFFAVKQGIARRGKAPRHAGWNVGTRPTNYNLPITTCRLQLGLCNNAGRWAKSAARPGHLERTFNPKLFFK